MGNLRCSILRKNHPFNLRGGRMKYQNTKTGFVFDSDSKCSGEDWVDLSPSPATKEPKAVKEEPVEPKRTKKNGNSK